MVDEKERHVTADGQRLRVCEWEKNPVVCCLAVSDEQIGRVMRDGVPGGRWRELELEELGGPRQQLALEPGNETSIRASNLPGLPIARPASWSPVFFIQT